MLSLSGVIHRFDDGSSNQEEKCLDGANPRYGGHTANLSSGKESRGRGTSRLSYQRLRMNRYGFSGV
jgi:hypothetical protein